MDFPARIALDRLSFSFLSALLQEPVPSVPPDKFNNFMLLGYGVLWLVAVVYVVSLSNRQRNLQHDIQLMQRLLQEEEETTNDVEIN